ncbi:hypothetical protein F01_140205 [Burkholderia cenocepacia]|nr:hypothetical protein F01_140205 [Burkholderia cenocepacia]
MEPDAPRCRDAGAGARAARAGRPFGAGGTRSGADRDVDGRCAHRAREPGGRRQVARRQARRRQVVGPAGGEVGEGRSRESRAGQDRRAQGQEEVSAASVAAGQAGTIALSSDEFDETPSPR